MRTYSNSIDVIAVHRIFRRYTFRFSPADAIIDPMKEATA
jgi:hypothetical protein